MKYSQQHAAGTLQTDQKYKDLRPTIHAPSAEQVVKAIWRVLLPETERALARARREERYERCLVCGGELDTGWECNDCGWDGIAWYVPYYRPPTEEEIRRLETGKD